MTAQTQLLVRRLPLGATNYALLIVCGTAVGLGVAAGFRRLVAAIVVALGLLAIGSRHRASSVVGVLCWLTVLGLVRRMAYVIDGPVAQDPLLLVAPACAVILVLAASREGAFDDFSALSRSVLCLSVLITAGAVNPLQGGTFVGIAGLLFVLVPVLWFWIGRGLMTDSAMSTVVMTVGTLGVIAAVFGLSQTYWGLTSVDATYVAQRGYAALNVGDTVRPFASFTAASEYALYTAISLVLWSLRAFRANPIALVTAAILLWALVLESSRGVLIYAVVTVVILQAVRTRMPLPLLIASSLAGLLLVQVVASHYARTARFDDPRTGALLQHQVEGLADPFDDDKSTANTHLSMVQEGVSRATQHPLGRGVGVTNLAASQFGDGGGSSELDPSNVAIALGWPGLLAYLAVAALGIQKGFRAARSGGLLALAVFGILLVTAGQWLNGGNYAVAPLPWLCLGWLDAKESPRARPSI